MYECPDCGLIWSEVQLVPGTKRTKRLNPPKRRCGCGLTPPKTGKKGRDEE